MFTAGIILALIFGFTTAGYTQNVDLEHQKGLQISEFTTLPEETYHGIADVMIEQNDDKPALSEGRIASEILVGGATGIGTGLVGAFAFRRINTNEDCIFELFGFFVHRCDNWIQYNP